MVQYSRDNNTKKYISADGQIMGGGTAYKGDDGKWSLDKPQEQTNNQSDFNNKGNTTQTTPTTPTPTPNESNFNNQNGTDGQNNVSTDQFTNFVKGGIEGYNSAINNSKNNSNEVHDYYNDFNNKVEEYKKTHPERDSTEYDNYKKQFDSYGTYSPDLDQTKFQQDPGKITVQEGTAQQTGRPDYQANSEARLNEMKGNLDHYFATSPRMFSDRETFNRVFEYNNRESEAQRQLLDSYWKRKEDMDKASQYTSGESIMNGMNNSEITTDQLNLIKDNDPEAYRKWQQLQEEEIKKRIVNDIVPPSIEAISGKINSMIEALGIQAQEALDIEGIYNDTMTKVGAYQTLEDCNRTVRKIEEVINKKNDIMNRYSASTGGTVSDALAAARMNKAIAPYNEQLQGLQYQYQDYSNLYSQKSATALQAANVRALQANENQRIWNQKCAALGFATSALSYRTPEQQAELQLKTLQAQNDIQLLQQSRLNDLNLYNQYATAKMQNQLQQELTDLSVEDETQLKANLNNALSTYYQTYGDIIQRSQAQAVEDIIAYAKKKGISVAQAMTENFIKPLQNKAEYKQKVASDYGMLSKQSIGTINGRSVIMTTNPNGSISYQFIDDPTSTEVSTTAKPYDLVDEKVLSNAPINYGYNTLGTFMLDKLPTYNGTGGQCGKFVNDYLEYIGMERYYDDELSTKLNSVNSDTPKEGTIAVFDYGHKSSDGINHGHVGIVTKVNKDGSFEVVDSNYDVNNPGKIQTRTIRPGSSSLKGFFDPSQPPRVTSTESEAVSYGGLTESQLESLAKQYIDGTRTYSDIAKTYGDDVLNAVGIKASILEELGYEKSKIITDPAKIMNAEQSLMTKFNSMNDGNQTALKWVNIMHQALDEVSADKKNNKKALNGASQAIVNAYNKILDEKSVVRESEYARTPEGQAYLDKLQGKLEQFTSGGAGLTYNNLKALVDLADSFSQTYQTKQNDLVQLIRNQANTYGLNEANILPLDVIQQLNNSGGITTGPADPIQKNFDGLIDTSKYSSTNTGVSASYMSSKAYFILNG